MKIGGADGAVLWTIVALGGVLRFFPIWFGDSYANARPDEEAAVLRAIAILGGDPNPHFFHWPSLTLYVFAGLFAGGSWIAQVFTGASLSSAEYTLIARAFVALAGTATILMAFELGRHLADTTTGLAAALFLAVSLLHVRDSHFAMTDVLMTLLVTMSLVVLVRAAGNANRTGRAAVRDFAIAGLLGGLAASTKYSAAAILAAMGAVQIQVLRHAWPDLRAREWAPGLAFVGAFAFGFVAGTPYAVLDYPAFQAGVLFTAAHLSDGHGVDLGPGWTYHVTRSLPYGVGIATCAAAIAGIVPLARKYPGGGAILGAFAAALYISLGSGRTVFFRYILPLVPVVCVSAAVAVRIGVAALENGRRKKEEAGRKKEGLVALAIAIPGLVSCIWFDVLLARTDTRVLAASWLEARIQAGDTLHDAAGPYTKLDLRHLRFHEWFFDPRTKSFGHPEGRPPDWLVLHESPVRQYASAPFELRQLAAERYTLVARFPATRGRSRSAIYDHQDAFFLPFSGFSTVIRPGPTISVYKLKGLVTSSPPWSRSSRS